MLFVPFCRLNRLAGCNVGYAFVNFINVQDLVHFATTTLGVKWFVSIRGTFFIPTDVSWIRNMYSSEKVLQMSYANYQCVLFFHLLPMMFTHHPQGQGGAR
jgi:hypothetical protein